MFFMHWLTTEPKGWPTAGPLLVLGIVFLVPFTGQVIGIVPRSTSAGLMLGCIALVSLIAGIVELLPRTQRGLAASGRVVAAIGLVAVVLWMLVKLLGSYT
jgi:hypothetical protein